MRQVIISIIGVLIIGGGYLLKEKFAATERPQRQKPKKTLSKVFTQEVKNGDTAIKVTASGNLAAKERIELFSEVQGIFEYSDKQFKPGVSYKNGDVLIRLNSEELRANLLSEKSRLQNILVGILPDLRFDYPDAFAKWESYINSFDVNQRLQPLPTASSDREKLFIAGRNITTTWYTVKNTQTIQAFIQVSGRGLREGMYLEALLDAKNEKNTFEMSRKLLVDNKKVFQLVDSTLVLTEVEPVHFSEKTVVVRGLEDGTEILERTLPGAYDGMRVERFKK